MSSSTVVELAKVGRDYRRGDEEVHALVELSLTLDAGELVALDGPSGCGKSTALNLVAAVDRPDRGRVSVCGVDIASASENELVRLRRRRIGMVFQAFHLVPHLTVEENVSLPLALDGRRGAVDLEGLRARTNELLPDGMSTTEPGARRRFRGSATHHRNGCADALDLPPHPYSS